jgi:polysaccharide pyruvyl transferase WcaK-like protein
MLGKPALAISFHEKDDSLMTAMGLQEFCQDIANFDVSTLIEQFIRLEENADRLRQEIRRKAKDYRRELDKQYSCIFDEIGLDLTQVTKGRLGGMRFGDTKPPGSQ